MCIRDRSLLKSVNDESDEDKDGLVDIIFGEVSFDVTFDDILFEVPIGVVVTSFSDTVFERSLSDIGELAVLLELSSLLQS